MTNAFWQLTNALNLKTIHNLLGNIALERLHLDGVIFCFVLDYATTFRKIK